MDFQFASYQPVCVIFGIRFSDQDDAKFSLGSDDSVYPFGNGWGAGPVAPNFMTDWEAAEPNDKRREASVLTFPTNFDYAGNRTDNWMEATGYQQKKICAVRSDGGKYYSWCAQNANGGNGATTGHYQVSHFQSMTLIRFADVLLMHSELTETADGMNRVRSRAGLPPIGYSLKALQDERRWELAFEGLRWDDIRRWGIAKEALQKQLGGKIYNAGKQTIMKTKAEVMPPVMMLPEVSIRFLKPRLICLPVLSSRIMVGTVQKVSMPLGLNNKHFNSV